jgi:triosephosphate isomerase
MKPIIIANWKCNPDSFKKAEALFSKKAEFIKDYRKSEVVICPPSVFLSSFSDSKIKLGAQNCYLEEGAYTGEVSPSMIKTLCCKYVLVGHSERRGIFGETDELVNKKIQACIKAGLKVVFCFGEEKSVRSKGTSKVLEVLEKQIKEGIKGINDKNVLNIIFAYEPIWAIGSGEACSPEKAEEIAVLVRDILKKKYSLGVSESVRVLYGGSANSSNSNSFLSMDNINGLLVGGASLAPKEFISILKNI